MHLKQTADRDARTALLFLRLFPVITRSPTPSVSIYHQNTALVCRVQRLSQHIRMFFWEQFSEPSSMLVENLSTNQ